MPDSTSSLLFLAVPGTQETRQLDLESVREAVARGEIGLDNWAWSADRNEWVPLAQLPEFAEPEPVMVAVPAPMPIVRVEPKPVVAVAAPTRVQTPVAGQHAATYYSKSIDDHPDEAPVLRILFIGLTLVIVALVGVNYFLIEQPFHTKMTKTPFAGVSAYAHLGAFMQPTALLIHVVPDRKINADNFADLLTALAQSAPRRAIVGMDFKTVSLTPGWLGRYLISSDDWAAFSDMSGFTPEEKRQFVLTHVARGSGAPLLTVHRNETPDQRQADEDAVWRQLVATFQGS